MSQPATAERLLEALRRRIGPARLRRYWRLSVMKTRFGTEIVRNYVIDRRYGGSCAGSTQTSFRHLGAYGTSSADYWQLRRVFSKENGVVIEPEDVLVDVGCGKGRVLNHWLEMGLQNRMVGIELDARFAEFASHRLRTHTNVEIVHGNAIELLPADGTIFFLFNPFNRGTLAQFAERIAMMPTDRSRLKIVYYFAMHADVFESDPRFEVEPFARTAFHPGMTARLAR